MDTRASLAISVVACILMIVGLSTPGNHALLIASELIIGLVYWTTRGHLESDVHVGTTKAEVCFPLFGCRPIVYSTELQELDDLCAVADSFLQAQCNEALGPYHRLQVRMVAISS